jgi:hypothetical protein
MRQKKDETGVINELAKTLCIKEGGKRQVDIAQMREIIKRLSKIIADDPLIIAALIVYGHRE